MRTTSTVCTLVRMAMKTLYVSEKDAAVWEEAAQIAKRRRTSLSKVIALQLRDFIRDQQSDGPPLPVGFIRPASMQDPKTQKLNAAIDRIQSYIDQEVRELGDSL